MPCSICASATPRRRGTQALRETLASAYEDTSADNILVTTGAIEANYLLFNTLLEPGDHVVAVYPAYQQLYAWPRRSAATSRSGSCGPRTASATTSTSSNGWSAATRS